MVGTRRLNSLVTGALALLDLPEGGLVVALSGGADSAALALLTLEAGRTARAVHVDHGLTGSPMMKEAAVAVARRLDIALQIVEVAVPSGASPEGMAREARYGALAQALRGGEILLTAHTAEDNLETVLINLVRGTGTRGLAGIPRRGRAGSHRPLLAVSRDATREIATLAQLPYADDPMNLDPSLARNHIRRRVVPELRALNPDLTATATRNSALVRADADLLDSMEGRLSMKETPRGLAVAVGDLRAAPDALVSRVLRSMLRRVGAPDGAEPVARSLAIAWGEGGPAQIGGGVTAIRRGALLHLERDDPGDGGTVPLAVGVTHHGGLAFEVAWFDEVCRVAPLGSWRAIFAPDASLEVGPTGEVTANGDAAWLPGVKRLPVAWYEPGTRGYLSVLAREDSGWTSSP